MNKAIYCCAVLAAVVAEAGTFPYGAEMMVRHQAASVHVASYDRPTVVSQVSAMPNTDSVATLVATNMRFEAVDEAHWTVGVTAVGSVQAALAIRNAAGRNCWMGYAGGQWIELSGADATEGEHIVKIDVDYSLGSGNRKIRYAVDDAVLTANGESWHAIGQNADRIDEIGLLGYGSTDTAVAKSGARQMEGTAAKVENVSMDYSKLQIDVAVTESWGVTGAKVTLHDGETTYERTGTLSGGKVVVDFSDVTEAGKSYTYDLELTGGYNGSTLEPIVTHTEQSVDLFQNVDWFGFADGQFVKAAKSDNIMIADKAFGTAGEKGVVTPTVSSAEGSETVMTATMNVTRAYPWAELPATAPQFAMTLARDSNGYRTWAVKTGNGAWTAVSPSVLNLEQLGAFKVTRITKDANGAVASVDLAFPATNIARKACIAWGISDRGDAFEDWENKSIVGTVAANATTLTVAIPNAIGTALANQGFRIFLGTTTAKDYVQDGLVVLYDCRENVGWGTYNASATTWRNLASDDRDTDLTLNTTGTPPDFFETDNVHLANSIYRKKTKAAVASEGDTISMELNMKPPAAKNDEDWFALVRGLGRVAFRYGVANFMVGHPQSNGKYCMRWFGGLFPTDSAYHTYTAAGFNRAGSSVNTAWSDGIQKTQPSGHEYGDGGDTTDTTYNFELGFSNNQVSMDIRSIRIYTKKLSDADIAQNRAVDESRFGDGVPFHFEASAYTRADFIVQNGTYDVKVTADYRTNVSAVAYYMKPASSSGDYYQLATGALPARKLNGVAVVGGAVRALNAAYRATSAVPTLIDETKNTIVLAANQELDLKTATQEKTYTVSKPAGKAYHLAWKDGNGAYATMEGGVLTVKKGTPKNGMDSFTSHILGFDPEKAQSKPFIAAEQNSETDKIRLVLPNVHQRDVAESGVSVRYRIAQSPDTSFAESSTAATAVDEQTFLIDVPTGEQKVKYYRVEVELVK